MAASHGFHTAATWRTCRRFATPLAQLLIAFLLVDLTAASLRAGSFSQLVVFGDSLSDVGNIAQASFDVYPGPHYFDDRFSNGPVYVERLAAGLGLPPMLHSRAGGTNFAHGGAQTSGTSGFEGLAIRDIDEQVDRFLATRTADPDALYLVFAGANDLLSGQTDVNVPIGNLAGDIGRLITAGARRLLLPNLPRLGDTPQFNDDPATQATHNDRTQQFNSALAMMLDGLEASHPAITLYRLDVAGLFERALAEPWLFGFTNVTEAAAPGLEPGDSAYDPSQIAADPNAYLFWDGLHPTAAVHAVLAQRALELFYPPGDFNRDLAVDAADYLVWRRGVGSLYAPDHYALWRNHFGRADGGTPAERVASVPEPAAAGLLVLAVLIVTLACRPLPLEESHLLG